MKGIIIKEMRSDQYTLYKSFFLEALSEDEDQFRITPDDEAKSDFPTKGTSDSFTLGVYVDTELAGTVSFERDGVSREKLRHKGLLFRMYVSGKFRRQGLGKLLVRELIKKAIVLGDIEQINLTVVAGNQKAKLLYEGIGFRTYGAENNAIKWRDQYFAEEFMTLHLKKTCLSQV